MVEVISSTSSSDICFRTAVLAAGPSDIMTIAAFCAPVREGEVGVRDSAMTDSTGAHLSPLDRRSRRIALVQTHEALGIAISPYGDKQCGFLIDMLSALGAPGMIKVTRLNHTPLILNSDLIEHIEGTPDTVITLTSGQKFMVLESTEEIVERVIKF